MANDLVIKKTCLYKKIHFKGFLKKEEPGTNLYEQNKNQRQLNILALVCHVHERQPPCGSALPSSPGDFRVDEDALRYEHAAVASFR